MTVFSRLQNKVFVEDKEMDFEEGKDFLISYVAWNLNEKLRGYFTNVLVLLDRKSLPTSKTMPFITKNM